MINNKKVAVLLATFNGSRYLREQIDSILCQENITIDIYVRDDNSIDETFSILEEYRQKNKNFHILDTIKNQLGPGRNFFSILNEIEIKHYDFISYCDQDDKWFSNKLYEAVNKIESENVNCYGSNLYIWDGDNVTGILSKSSVQTEYDFLFESASAGCTLVMDRKSANHLKNEIYKYFDKLTFEISHDWYTYAITRIGSFKWHIDNRAFIYYRQHNSNQYGANEGFQGIRNKLKLFTNGWYLRNIKMIIDFFCHTKPSFYGLLINYKNLGLIKRIKLAFIISKYRRELLHRFILFFLLIFKLIK